VESSADTALEQGVSVFGSTPELGNVTITSRSGPVTFNGQDAPLFKGDIEPPDSEEFRAIERSVQELDTRARKAAIAAAERARSTTDPKEREDIEQESLKEHERYSKEAIKLMKKIEKMADGDYKYVVQFSIGDRYRDAADCDYARRYYDYVVEDADDPGVSAYAEYKADSCEEFLPPASP